MLWEPWPTFGKVATPGHGGRQARSRPPMSHWQTVACAIGDHPPLPGAARRHALAALGGGAPTEASVVLDAGRARGKPVRAAIGVAGALIDSSPRQALNTAGAALESLEATAGQGVFAWESVLRPQRAVVGAGGAISPLGHALAAGAEPSPGAACVAARFAAAPAPAPSAPAPRLTATPIPAIAGLSHLDAAGAGLLPPDQGEDGADHGANQRPAGGSGSPDGRHCSGPLIKLAVIHGFLQGDVVPPAAPRPAGDRAAASWQTGATPGIDRRWRRGGQRRRPGSQAQAGPRCDARQSPGVFPSGASSRRVVFCQPPPGAGASVRGGSGNDAPHVLI